jgi:hypothetical protein
LRLPSINFIICFGDDTLYAAAAVAAAAAVGDREECEECEECDEEDNETRVEREVAEAEPRRDDELDLGEAEADEEDEDREACEADDIELLAAGDILLYCSGVPEDGLPFVILRLTIACNIRA